MARPKQPFIRHVLGHLEKSMASLTAEDQASLGTKELMAITGPASMTVSFMIYASMITHTNMSYLDFTGMTVPRLIGEVLILPIWAFGAQHQVKKAGFAVDEGTALVKHHFAGTWMNDHEGLR